jgi:hypothetical protein
MDMFEITEYRAEDLEVTISLSGEGFKNFLKRYNDNVGVTSLYGEQTKESLIDGYLTKKR